MKWLWRFPKERQSLWYKVIKSKFSLHSNQWDSNVVERGAFRSPWKAISSLYGEFHQKLAFKIGNGNRIRFWEDIWVDKNSLQLLFPSLFRISSLKARPIPDFWDQSNLQMGGPTSWNFYFSRNMSDRETIQMQELLQRLERQRLCPGVEDKKLACGLLEQFFVQISFCVVEKGQLIYSKLYSQIHLEVEHPNKGQCVHLVASFWQT